MSSNKYNYLAQDEDFTEEETDDYQVRMVVWWKRTVPILSSMLAISLILNLLAYSQLRVTSSSKGGATVFAGLTFNSEHDMQYQSRYNDPDPAITDAAWAEDTINPTILVVALDDSFTESQGILHSIRWPWDPKKGVYTLASSHQLHCLHSLRGTINQAFDGWPLTFSRTHAAHCLEYLLQNIMCYADVTPLYQGLLHQNKNASHPMGGLGDIRKCRDWKQLHSWARKHSACYNRTYKIDDPVFSEKERYKFCPDKSRPWNDIKH